MPPIDPVAFILASIKPAPPRSTDVSLDDDFAFPACWIGSRFSWRVAVAASRDSVDRVGSSLSLSFPWMRSFLFLLI